MPVKIDGPAGRQEVTDEYRKNYDRIFNGSSASTFCGQCGVTEKCKDCTPQCDNNGKSPGECINYSLYWNGKKVWESHSDKQKKDGGKNAKSNS